jgi:hypothetical protein
MQLHPVALEVLDPHTGIGIGICLRQWIAEYLHRSVLFEKLEELVTHVVTGFSEIPAIPRRGLIWRGGYAAENKRDDKYE